MDHADLIAEFPQIEKLTPAERIKLARERRALQLEKCLDRYKREELDGLSTRIRQLRLRFKPEIALLESAARGDVTEVKRLLEEEKADPNSHNEDGLTPLHQVSTSYYNKPSPSGS